MKYPNTKGLIVRKTYPELLSNHIRKMFKEYPLTINWYKAGEKAIYWPNGSITEFSHLASLMDVYTYQGREYEDISIDEVTQHEETVFKILRSSNRTTNKDFVNNGGNVSMLLTGNPGGIGHGWVKRMFIDRTFQDNENPDDFDFVQAKVWDNKALMEADPNYLIRLKDLPKDLMRAYLEGDWDVFAGQVFSEFRREMHICNPVLPNPIHPHFLWIDWGYSGREEHEGAFACLAAALVQENYQGTVFNRIIVYKEWYGKFKDPREWAKIIYETSEVKNYKEVVADSAMFNTQTDGSKPIAKLMEDEWDILCKRHWITVKAGTKNRIGRVATLHNWLSIAPDGLPYMLVTESCPNLIRTLPLLVHDPYKVEDVDTTGEDHLYDALGYGLSAVKFISAKIGSVQKELPKKKSLPATLMELDLTAFEKAKLDKGRDWKASL
jgi:phage terminase large subunit